MSYTGKNGEANFEQDLVDTLIQKGGWEPKVLQNYNEKDFIENWRTIISERNRDKLNNIPLSEEEMRQIIEYVNLNCTTPVKANLFINGKDVCVKRDVNSTDKEHAGKEVFLNIFDPLEVAGGKTRYQIARQPKFKTGKDYNDRRGDVTLLINGIPVIHIELKANGVKIEEAANQIAKYAREGVFTGIFSLVQIFIAMTPEDIIYFANPGDYIKFNNAFFFHWADMNNNVIKDWRELCSGENAILSIPPAHEFIRYYTVPSKSSDTLMVVRSYQYHAIRKILERARKQRWGDCNQLGGYVWCTTGGGKTLTSFKSGQLIIDKGLADKVVFLVDRIELNVQSLEEYNSFQRDGEDVEETGTTNELFSKLKDNKSKLIITSIQKLNRINDDAEKQKQADLDCIKNKRIVFIIDEAHRSNFGEMHERIKKTFPIALFFGFTGTPIFDENNKNGLTTETVFGKCLSIYSIADGIKDKNVLGFDPTAVKTYKDEDLKKAVALNKFHVTDEEKLKKDKNKFHDYLSFLKSLKMSSYKDGDKVIPGVEDLLPSKQYDCDEHRRVVVDDIIDNWDLFSLGCEGTRFHAILATNSIPEACEYYKLFKEKASPIRVTALFDANIGNNGEGAIAKEDALIEIVDDYNKMFGMHFDRKTDSNLKLFKKDIVARLSHKNQYKNMNIKGDKDTLDLVIVVDQLLTGFDSKFINTLYLDKFIAKHDMIQAISRTNRVYNNREKMFGIFRFYRKPYTMKKEIFESLKMYCNGDTSVVVVKTIKENIKEIHSIYQIIEQIFKDNDIDNFCCLPKSEDACDKFKKEFLNLERLMNTIKLQGFKYDISCNQCMDKDTCTDKTKCEYKLPYDKDTYEKIRMRFEDLRYRKGSSSKTSGFGYDIDASKSEMEMDKIDSDYLESHFRKIIPIITSNEKSESDKEEAIIEFEHQLPKLSEINQKYAKMILLDIRNGKLIIEKDKTLMMYIEEYKDTNINLKLNEIAELFGLDKELFKKIYMTARDERDLDEYGRFKKLRETADDNKVIEYFSKNNKKCSLLSAKGKLNKFLEDLILNKRI